MPSQSQVWGTLDGKTTSSLPLEQVGARSRGEESGGEDCREAGGEGREDSDPPASSCGRRKREEGEGGGGGRRGREEGELAASLAGAGLTVSAHTLDFPDRDLDPLPLRSFWNRD